MTAQRYLCVAAHTGDLDLSADQLTQRVGLPTRQIGPACFLAIDQPPVMFLSGQRGAVVGKVFERDAGYHRVSSLGVDTQEDLMRGGGAKLLARHWGGYVAISCGARGICVRRDPSGAMPCYYVQKHNLWAFASDPALLIDAGLLDPEIDWSELTRFLYSGALPSTQTCLHGLREISPGTAVTTRGDQHEVQQWWSPWDYTSRDGTRDETFHVDLLQSVLQGCVGAWASSFDAKLIGVSGGLDSSIVAVCVPDAHAQLTCATLVTRDPAGDERRYAKPLCERLGAELVEIFYDVEAVDIAASCVAHLPRPSGRTATQFYNIAMQALCRDRRSDALFSGNGGDNVFAFSQSARPLVDRYRSEGLGVGLLDTLGDISRLTGASILQVLAAARRIKRANAYSWKADTRFLHADVVTAERRAPLNHPWLKIPSGGLPGQAAHIAGLLRVQPTLDGFDRASHPPTVNPLMSQPVMELCLAIPSWQWCSGGENRAIARRAFKGRLPEMILSRRSKGTPDSFSQQLLDRHFNGIRERLLDGRLAASGIVDRATLEAFFRGHSANISHERVRIFSLLDTEAWIEHWQRLGRDVVPTRSASSMPLGNV